MMFKSLQNLDFSQALEALSLGVKVSRAGWNGKQMYIRLIQKGYFGQDIVMEPFIVMFTAQRKYIPWIASQSDLLANDWRIEE